MIGETIGNFRITSRLGRGGMGEVYAAEQTSIGTKVAVKVLHPQVSEDDDHVRRFFNEAKAVAKIQHAGIVKIFDVGKLPAGNAYLVMEYLAGESLAQRIKRLGKLHPAEVAELGRQIASVLDATHGAGITHRDLKPDNVFLIADRELASGLRVKILDFGIAKISGTLAGNSPQTIGTMGTPAYMAPEQWGDTSKVDWRADLYSLGCVAFEMACGRPPFVVTTIGEACGKHMSEPPPHVRKLVPELPTSLDALIDDLLAKRPDDRTPGSLKVEQRFAEIAKQLGPAPKIGLPAPVVDAIGETIAVGTPSHAKTTGLDATVASTEPSRARPAAATSENATALERKSPASKRPAAPPAKRRWPLVVGALVLAGGGAATAIMMMRHDSADTPPPHAPPARPFCPIAAMPVLDGASSGPVELRYAFEVGQTTEVTAIAHGIRDTSDITVTLSGKVTWTAVEPDRRYGGRFVTERASVDVPGHHWSSDDPNEHVAPQDLQFTFAIGPHGELLESDLARLDATLAQHQGRNGTHAALQRDELVLSMFPRLPDHPVKVGDTWRAGDLVRPLPRNGSLSAAVDMRVQAISKDGTQVLLVADPELRVDLPGTVPLVAKRTEMHAWAELDRQRHEISSSTLRACAVVTVDLDGARTDVTTEVAASYDSRPLGVQAPPPPPQQVDAGVADATPVADAAPSPEPAPPLTGLAKEIRDQSTALQACAPPGGARGVLRLTIGSDGRVTRASVKNFDEDTGECLVKGVRKMTFPRRAGAPTFTVDVPLVLAAPAP